MPSKTSSSKPNRQSPDAPTINDGALTTANGQSYPIVTPQHMNRTQAARYRSAVLLHNEQAKLPAGEQDDDRLWEMAQAIIPYACHIPSI